MTNCKMTVKGTILTVEIDLEKDYGPSASGKNNIIASTGGNIGVPEHPRIKIGLNCYTKAVEAGK
jgi:hypothetical protein